MELVQKCRLPVVEIDHFRDGWHDRPFPLPLKSMDKQGNVIYIGSFLRCYPFDFQMSWIVADKYIIEHMSDVLVQNGVKINFLLQLAADELFRSGAYDEMMRAARKFIKKRREKALELCSKYLSGVARWDAKNCWFHFWLEFPGIDIRKLFQEGIYNNFYPGYFFDKSDLSHILLCPAFVSEDILEKAIGELALIGKK